MNFLSTKKAIPAMVIAMVLASYGYAAAQYQDIEQSDEADAAALMDEAPIGSLGVRLAYNSNLGSVVGVNFTSSKVFGLPHHLGISAEASKSDQRLSFDYVIPSLGGGAPEWGISVYRNDSRVTTAFNFETLSYGIRPSWSKSLSDQAQLAFVAELSSDRISNVALGSSALIAADLGRRTKTGFGVRYVWQDEQTLLRLSSDIASTSVKTSFVKTEASLLRLWTAPEASVQFTSNLSIGHLTMLKGQSNIGDRFFLGSGLMRGFDTAGVGPRDLAAGNAALGGNSYAALKLDVTFPNALPNQHIFMPGLFVDAGSIWGLNNVAGGAAGTSPVDASMYVRSTFGISASFDLGSVSLNLYASRPIKKRPYDKVTSFQISLGSKF